MARTYYILKDGIAPPDLGRYPEAVRLLFWGWVVEIGLEVKDGELARGLNAAGGPLPPVSRSTRRHRRSAMTPSGRGDPRAPYLMPGRGLSRTRSLLTGKPHDGYAEFWWRFDPFTGDTWARVLAYHARRGEAYDVVGLSPRGVRTVARRAQERFRAWKGGTSAPTTPPAVARLAEPVRTRVVGRTDLEHVTFGIGASKAEVQQAVAEGRFSGFMTADEWRKHWRGRAPVPSLASPGRTAVSVRKGSSNVLLRHIWGDFKPAGATMNPGAKLDWAVDTLVDAIRTGPALTVEQLIAIVGSSHLFGEAVTEALRKRLLVIGRDEQGRITLRVVG